MSFFQCYKIIIVYRDCLRLRNDHVVRAHMQKVYSLKLGGNCNNLHFSMIKKWKQYDYTVKKTTFQYIALLSVSIGNGE